jgi:hypothetical protein
MAPEKNGPWKKWPLEENASGGMWLYFTRLGRGWGCQIEDVGMEIMSLRKNGPV